VLGPSWSNRVSQPDGPLRLIRTGGSVQEPADGDLAYMSALRFFIQSPNHPKVAIAQRNGFPAGLCVVLFDVPGVELKPSFTDSAVSVTSEVDASGCPAQDQSLR